MKKFLFGAAVIGLAGYIGLGFYGMPLVERDETIAEMQAAVSLSAERGRYDVDELADTINRLQEEGVPLHVARSVMKGFVAKGVPQDDMGTLAGLARAVSTATGRPVSSVARDLAAAFHGGGGALVDLDRTLNFLTAEQYGEVRRLQEEGRFESAATLARDILVAKMIPAAD